MVWGVTRGSENRSEVGEEERECGYFGMSRRGNDFPVSYIGVGEYCEEEADGSLMVDFESLVRRLTMGCWCRL